MLAAAIYCSKVNGCNVPPRLCVTTCSLRSKTARRQRSIAHWHYTAVTGWLGAHPEVFIFNRRNLNQVTNKPLVLKLAQDSGLPIPRTLITNDRERLADFLADQSGVVKPINGGGYCEPLAQVLEHTAVKDGRRRPGYSSGSTRRRRLGFTSSAIVTSRST